jgi:hypothetical protein
LGKGFLMVHLPFQQIQFGTCFCISLFVASHVSFLLPFQNFSCPDRVPRPFSWYKYLA